jgi:biotin carboxyl carrier protein
VAPGDLLVTLEAMKMELPIRATTHGTVTTINCRVGDLVQPGIALLELRDEPGTQNAER